MGDALKVKLRRRMIPIPGPMWRRLTATQAKRGAAGLRFMGPDHHRVRDFVVTELPRRGQALPPEDIADAIALALPEVQAILDELERHKMFLYRTDGRLVDWAYPVTVAPTPHRLAFDSGERLYAA